MKSGNLNFLETSGQLQACDGTAFPFIRIFIVMFTPKRLECIGTTQPPIELVPAVLFLELQRAESKICDSSPSGGEVNNEWRNTSIPPIRLQDVTEDSFAVAVRYSSQIQTHYSK